MNRVLEKFDASLSPLTAQFCLASHIVEHQTALGSGVFEVSLNGLADRRGRGCRNEC